MAYDTFNALWRGKWGSGVRRKARLHVAQFGDNYRQASPDGLNHNPEVWNMSWETDATTAQAIEDWLVAHDAVPFKWTNPKGVLIQVTCGDDEISHTWDNYGTHTVTSVFKQDFSPEV